MARPPPPRYNHYLMVHIGLNAHLLAAGSNYRRAGIHGYIYNLLAHLPAADPDLRYTVFYGAGEPPPHPAMTARRARLDTANPLRRIVWEQAVQPFAVRECDLVHELAFVAPALMPRPFVVTVHDLSFIRYPERLPALRRLYLRTLTGISCRAARRVIAVSQSTANDVVSLLGIPPEKIDVILHGVEPRFAPLPPDQIAVFRAKHNLPDQFFLFVGTIEPRKNLPTLIRAYATLPEATRRRVGLVLAGGSGWDGGAAKALAESLGVGDQVLFPGYVPDEDLPIWYNCCLAFVYPSIFEGWGLPIVEAMACGAPVIVSDASSMPEAAGTAGVCLPPDDVPAWTAALARAVDDPEWRATSSENSRKRAAHFTWHTTAQRTVESYKKALT